MLRTLLAALAALLSLEVVGQNPTTLEGWAERLKTFGDKIPQEEVFVHMDNTSYYLGDTIYYKVYMRLSDGRPSPLSRLLYVELFNQDGYLVERQKVEMKRGQGYGSFALLDTLYGGYYELRAYTRWQLNWGEYQHPHTKYAEEDFYSKKMAHDYYRDYDKLYSRVFPVFDKPSKAGEYDQVMTTRPLRRYFKSRPIDPKAKLTFYPEGGNLVTGAPCRVAFEANSENDGHHLKGTLTVKDKAGNTVAQAETENRGRGTFVLDCKTGEKYTAEFAWDNNTETAHLPKVEEEGCALQARSDAEGIRLTLENRGAAASEPLGVTASCHGRLKSFLTLDAGANLSALIPASELETGVIHLTVFNASGRIYADRLVFMDKGDIEPQTLTFSGIHAKGYEPYEPVEMSVKGKESATISLAVRDSRNSVYTFDSGNMLTEMLLSSQIKGFVEQPEYYFESNDEEHRSALDLLLMVQGWRRYNWVEMATPGAFKLSHSYERTELITGSVNNYNAVEQSNVYTDALREMVKDADMDADAEARKEDERVKASQKVKGLSQGEEIKSKIPEKQHTQLGVSEAESKANQKEDEAKQRTLTGSADPRDKFHENEGNLKREVRVHAEFVQPGASKNNAVVGDVETYGGKFKIEAPHFYYKCVMHLGASDTTKWKKGKSHTWITDNEDKNGRLEYPEFYVKTDPIYPRFVKPYSYYQSHQPESRQRDGKKVTVDDAIILDEVTIGAKRNGMRHFDGNKPAFVLDAYQAFNDACDAGLCPGYFIGGLYFCDNIARTYIGDMNMSRRYPLEIRYNTKRTQERIDGKWFQTTSTLSKGEEEKFNHLTYLDKIYIFTDYSPRYEGSEKYNQDNQPLVTIGLQSYDPSENPRMTWRDRCIILSGFAVCEDFYHPDYTNKPTGEPTDYRRTLYWNPELQLDANGEAHVRFFNNARQTQLTISAEGMTPEGTPLTGISYPEDQ